MRAAEYNHYDDINNWWRGDGVCSDAGWRLTRELKDEKREQEVNDNITILHCMSIIYLRILPLNPIPLTLIHNTNNGKTAMGAKITGQIFKCQGN